MSFCVVTWQISSRVWCHDDVIKWKHFPRYWPFVRGIHRSPVNSPHKGQWRGALIFSLICVWINDWVNTRETGDLRRYRVHYDVIVMVERCIVPPGLSPLFTLSHYLTQACVKWILMNKLHGNFNQIQNIPNIIFLLKTMFKKWRLYHSLRLICVT